MTLALMLMAGAVGAVLRYGIEHALERGPERALHPLIIVNVAGSAVLGALLALSDDGRLSSSALLIGGTGFCGGLTTFSGFSMATITTAQFSRRKAVVLAGGAVIACGLAAAVGAMVAGVR